MRIGKYGNINDMPRGWCTASEENRIIHSLWYRCFYRSYDENFHKKEPSYKDCIIRNFNPLSKFVSWVYSLDIYKEFKNNPTSSWSVDKDYFYPGNKIYSPQYCYIVLKEDNTKERNARCGNPFYNLSQDSRRKRDIACYKPIIAIPLDNNLPILEYICVKDAFKDGHRGQRICECCKGTRKSYHGYKWYYKKDYEVLKNE